MKNKLLLVFVGMSLVINFSFAVGLPPAKNVRPKADQTMNYQIVAQTRMAYWACKPEGNITESAPVKGYFQFKNILGPYFSYVQAEEDPVFHHMNVVDKKTMNFNSDFARYKDIYEHCTENKGVIKDFTLPQGRVLKICYIANSFAELAIGDVPMYVVMKSKYEYCNGGPYIKKFIWTVNNWN